MVPIKPLIVCIDTNVFVREVHLLRKKEGPSLIHFLRAANGKFFVPDILRGEYIEQTVAAVAQQRDEIAASYDRVLTLIGHRDDFQVPSDADAQAAAEARLTELSSLVLGHQITDDILVAAGRRVIAKKPPTSKSDHGYKDCLIWESILRLEAGTEVRLVTRDTKAFMSEAALPEQLRLEAAEREIRVVAYSNLEAVLRELQLQGAPVFDVRQAIAALEAPLKSVRDKLTKQWSLSSLDEIPSAEFRPYYTEEAARLYMTFSLRYTAGTAIFNEVPYDGDHQVELEGSFAWYPEDARVEDLQVEHEKLIGSDGSVVAQNRTLFVQGGFVGGRRSIPYQVKRPLYENLL